MRLLARIIDSVASIVLFKLIDVVRCLRCLGDRNEPAVNKMNDWVCHFSIFDFIPIVLPEFDRDLIADVGTVVGDAGQNRSDSF